MGDMESPSSEQARHLAAALLGGLDGARARCRRAPDYVVMEGV